MILEAAEHVEDILNVEEITDLLSDSVFWELAEQSTQVPFMVFSLASDGGLTKNGLNGFDVTLRIFAESMTSAAGISKSIINYLKDNKIRWRNRGAVSGYTDTQAKTGYIELKYNFKL